MKLISRIHSRYTSVFNPNRNIFYINLMIQPNVERRLLYLKKNLL